MKRSYVGDDGVHGDDDRVHGDYDGVHGDDEGVHGDDDGVQGDDDGNCGRNILLYTVHTILRQIKYLHTIGMQYHNLCII